MASLGPRPRVAPTVRRRTPARRVRRRLPPGDRREELKLAAVSEFFQRGYQSTTVDHIVAAADAAKGTFYLYFPTKQALFLELLDDFARTILESFAALDIQVLPAVGATPADIEQFLASAYRRFFAACQEHAGLARLFLQEALFDPVVHRKRQEIYDAFGALARRGLDAGVTMQILRPMDTRVVAHAIVGMIERVAVECLLVDQDISMETLVRELARFEARGILA